MAQNKIWEIRGQQGPLIATAIHAGHHLREEVAEQLVLPDEVRLREEDPFTEEWVAIGHTQIIVSRSRFEVDLNRPREKAVYQKPEDAWGLNLYKSPPSPELVSRSLEEYDAFYKEIHQIFSNIETNFRHFVVLDLHSYNFLREGENGNPADPDMNPEVNIGTGAIDRSKWAPLIDRFIFDLSAYNYFSRKLDVRENVKFKGGEFSRWIQRNFPNSACTLSIEFKKFFMNEWTGIPDQQQLKENRLALESTLQGILEELEKQNHQW